MSTLVSTLHAVTAHAALFDLTSCPVFSLSGPDAVRYLHGRITQDVKGVPVGMTRQSLVLTPQGKIQGHFWFLRRADSVLIVSDPLDEAGKTSFVQALLQFKVADLVDCLDLSKDYQLYSIQGPESIELLRQAGGTPPEETGKFIEWQLADGTAFVVGNPRFHTGGFDLLLPSPQAESYLKLLRLDQRCVQGDVKAYEMLRIAHGQPLYNVDISEKVLAPEINVQELVSFEKGCYAGQEVVEMATARGRPNRKLTVVEGSFPQSPLIGESIVTKDVAGNAKEIGEISSIAYEPTEKRFIALALLKSSELGNPIFYKDAPIRMLS